MQELESSRLYAVNMSTEPAMKQLYPMGESLRTCCNGISQADNPNQKWVTDVTQYRVFDDRFTYPL